MVDCIRKVIRTAPKDMFPTPPLLPSDRQHFAGLLSEDELTKLENMIAPILRDQFHLKSSWIHLNELWKDLQETVVGLIYNIPRAEDHTIFFIVDRFSRNLILI